MKKSVIILAGLAVIVSAVAFMGAVKSLPLATGLTVTSVSGTYASGQTDTVKFTREAGLSGLSFSIDPYDSCNLTRVYVRRVVNGSLAAAVAGDTLISAADSTATGAPWVKSVTLSPICDQYWFFVVYASDKGALNQSTLHPSVVYRAHKQFAK